MKIAIIATNFQSLSPKDVIYAPLMITKELAEGLQERGHEVTLFASSDSESKTKISSGNLPSLRKNKEWDKVLKKIEEHAHNPYFKKKAVKYAEVLRQNYELFLSAELFKRAGEFDIIQTHSPPQITQLAAFTDTPVAVTSHDPYSYPVESGLTRVIYEELSRRNKNVYFLSLSESQKKQSDRLPFIDTVYNGIDTKKFRFSPENGDYLLFVGRMHPGKGAHTAAQVAKETGEKLKLVGPSHKHRDNYWSEKIEPFLSDKITYEGSLPREELIPLYQNAKALLMPIESEESFGLVMIEAMACGTPVIGFNRYSVPEIVTDKKTGFLVKDKKEMLSAITKIDLLDRANCRSEVEERFTIDKMVERYEKAYEKILKTHRKDK